MVKVHRKSRRNTRRVYVTLKDATGTAKRTRHLTVYGLTLTQMEESIEKLGEAHRPQSSKENHGPDMGREMTPGTVDAATGANTSNSPVDAGEELCSDVQNPSGTCDGIVPSSHQVGSSTTGGADHKAKSSGEPRRQAARAEQHARSAGKQGQPPAVS